MNIIVSDEVTEKFKSMGYSIVEKTLYNDKSRLNLLLAKGDYRIYIRPDNTYEFYEADSNGHAKWTAIITGIKPLNWTLIL